MSRIVGIDLGTTNSLVAVVDSGIPYVVAGPDGKRLTPSVVRIDHESVEVGAAAKRSLSLHPKQTFYSVKRFIGRRSDEISDVDQQVSYDLNLDSNDGIRLGADDHCSSPEEISAEILKQLKSIAESDVGEPITRAVITVPAYFNDAQRNATKRAGELAGLQVERIVNEPTAAALAYGLDRLKTKARIAVYDLGGGTFDLTILELNEGVFQVLATSGNTRLGGDDIDRAIVDRIAKLIADSDGPAIGNDPTLFARVREEAERIKIALTTADSTTVALPFLTPEFSFEQTFTREELERLSQRIVERTRENCLRALADAKIEPRDLDQVILVGGQTRMPLVRRFVAEVFKCSDFEAATGNLRVGSDPHQADGPQLNTSQNPDEAVALGAAIQGAILSGEMKDLLLLDITPLSLGVETFGGLMNVIVLRNTTIPVKAGEMFTTAVDNQKSMSIHVLQGEREKADANWSLGRFDIDFQPAPRGVARVGVQFEIDANGILHVLARDIQSGKEKVVEIRSAVNVDDADVQQMVEESVEHAFSDLALRRWTESKLRATQTLEASVRGLAENEKDLSDEETSTIREAQVELEAALAKEDVETGAGDVERLKSAIQRLDQASLPLAELMMDKAMEAMLRKQGLIKD